LPEEWPIFRLGGPRLQAGGNDTGDKDNRVVGGESTGAHGFADLELAAVDVEFPDLRDVAAKALPFAFDAPEIEARNLWHGELVLSKQKREMCVQVLYIARLNEGLQEQAAGEKFATP
jgi:hypothetical protein